MRVDGCFATNLPTAYLPAVLSGWMAARMAVVGWFRSILPAGCKYTVTWLAFHFCFRFASESGYFPGILLVSLLPFLASFYFLG